VGNNSNSDVLAPTQVASGSLWTSVAAGDSHTLAVKSDGKLFSWGYNSSGQLGNGTLSSSGTHALVPTQVGTATNWVSVSAGWTHSAALNVQKALYTWGDNTYGQLGDGSTNRSTAPVAITGGSFDSVACGGLHTVAIVGSGIKAWGYNGAGQLGDETTTQRNAGVDVLIAGTAVLSGTAVSVAAGGAFSGAVISSGSSKTVYMWGNNAYGQLGDGTSGIRRSPAVSITGSNWAKVSGAPSHTLALTSGGLLYGWGTNLNGELGDSVTQSRAGAIQIGSDMWKSIAAGDGFSMGVKNDGTLWGWGTNANNELGISSTSEKYTPTPVGTGLTWDSVSVGSGFGLGLLAAGDLYAWGMNPAGQLGDGTNTSRTTPVRASSLRFSKVVAGVAHALGIEKTTGKLYAWGTNSNGQLGDGSNLNRSSPREVFGSGTWIDIAAGASHSLAVKSDGTVWAFGGNSSGALGQSNKTDSNVPVQVSLPVQGVLTAGGTVRVFADGSTSAAIVAGSLYTWGRNIYGQVGDGSLVDRLSPVLMPGGSGWTEADLGADNFAAIKGGTMYTWGVNGVGQLGYGVDDYKARPVVNGSAPVLSGSYTAQIGSAAAVPYNVNVATGGTFQFVEGESIRIAPSLSGTEPFTYSWKKDGDSYALATSEQLAFDPAAAVDAGTYELTVTNNYGQASFTVNLSQYTAPANVSAPAAQNVVTGGTISLAVEASGTDLTYQWSKGSTVLSNLTSLVSGVAGVTTGTLTLNGVQAADAGNYTLTVGNFRNGVAATGTTATVSLAVLSPVTGAAITVNGTPATSLASGTLTVNPGDAVSFVASATNATGYQWRKNTVVLDGATSASLSLASVSVDDSGEYDVVASNAVSEQVVSTVLVVRAPIVITKSPASRAYKAGDSLSLSVNASGTDITYQWYLDGVSIPGATSDTYTKTASASDSGTYYCVVSSPGYPSVTSASAVVTVTAGPAFASPAFIQTGSLATGAVTLTGSLSATSGTPARYVWRRNGATIQGANSISYTATRAGAYDLTIGNTAGSAIASVTLSASKAPVINTQPVGATVASGETVTLTVVATDVTGYKWFRNGVEVPGATAASLTTGDAGDYYVQVFNGALSLKSQTVKLLVNTSLDQPPVITQHPVSASAFTGSSVALRVAATGSNLTFQWYKGTQPINDGRGESSTLVLRSVTAADEGSYSVIVSSGEAQTASNAAEVTVPANPYTTLYGRTGQFAGRLDATTGVRGGYLNVSLTRQGAVSCRISIGNSVYRVVGRLDGTGRVSLPFGLASASPLVLTVDTSEGAPKLQAARKGMDSPVSLAQLGNQDYTLKGNYTAAARVGGALKGYLLSSVTQGSGRVITRGALSDGTRFTATSLLHDDPDDPEKDPVADLWAILSTTKTLLGKLEFTSTEVSGDHVYERETAGTVVSVSASVEGAVYTPPESGGVLLPLLSVEENFTVGISTSGASIYDAASLRYTNNRFVVFKNAQTEKRNVLSFTAANGFFSGTVYNLTTPTFVSGVVIQGGFREKTGFIGCGVSASGQQVFLDPIVP
jgi:alpha-tubulin suppressor-like RCC1 family protein